MSIIEGDGVVAAWHRVTTWCAEHAPATAAALRPPAGEGAITAAEQATGRVWPAELKAWYRLHDGVDRSRDGYFLPFNRPLPLADLVQDREVLLTCWSAMTTWHDRTLAEREADPAGTVSGTFLRPYLPIGDNGLGDVLVLDTRGGSLRGPIFLWDHVDADTAGPSWPSLTAMLQDAAAALETGSLLLGSRPTVVDGELGWGPADDL